MTPATRKLLLFRAPIATLACVLLYVLAHPHQFKLIQTNQEIYDQQYEQFLVRRKKLLAWQKELASKLEQAKFGFYLPSQYENTKWASDGFKAKVERGGQSLLLRLSIGRVTVEEMKAPTDMRAFAVSHHLTAPQSTEAGLLCSIGTPERYYVLKGNTLVSIVGSDFYEDTYMSIADAQLAAAKLRPIGLKELVSVCTPGQGDWPWL